MLLQLYKLENALEYGTPAGRAAEMRLVIFRFFCGVVQDILTRTVLG